MGFITVEVDLDGVDPKVQKILPGNSLYQDREVVLKTDEYGPVVKLRGSNHSLRLLAFAILDEVGPELPEDLREEFWTLERMGR